MKVLLFNTLLKVSIEVLMVVHENTWVLRILVSELELIT